ncbi:MAG: hypothetical protein LBP65_04200, partial [Puniceicoccales bacterium]|nr:hypothetical protein [Puniceicoccales bacterium]
MPTAKSTEDESGSNRSFPIDLRELGGVFALMGLATKDDIRDVRSEIREARAAAKEDGRTLREELKSDIEKVRKELKSDIGKVHEELKSDIGKVREELHGVKGYLAKWMAGTVVGIVGLMIAQTTLLLT